MLHQRLGWRAFLWTIVIVSISQSAQASLNARQTDQAAISSRRGPPFAHNQHQQLVATRHHYHSPNQAQAHFEQPDQDYQNRETYEELLSSSSRSGSSLDNDQLQVQQAPSLQQSARERCRELISLTLLSFKDLSPDERASEEIDCANLREQIAQASSSVNSSSRQLSARQQQRARPGNQFVDPETNSQQNQASVGHHSQNLHLAATQPADEFPLAPIYNRDSAPLRQFNNIQPVSNVSLAENSFIASTSWQPKQQNSYVNQMQQLLILQQQQRQRLQQESLANQQQFDVATTLPPPTTQATTFESLFETTALPATTTTTTSTTTTTTTTTTTPAPIIPKLRVGGNRRKPKQLRTSTTTTTTTTTTQKPSEEIDDASTDYETEPDYESDYTTTTTTTTQRPRHKNQNQKQQRARRPRTSTTPKPTTTTTTLSPGYQPRPDGRIIDYMADPNFPRELKGADLTNYPFYISVPEKIDFECRGRHDGYYANIDLHCQIYHHCAVGNRYDFLCPNYTLFDQTTFTCRFINTVDCVGSEKHFDRNNALYVEKDEKEPAKPSSTSAPSSSSTAASSTTSATTAGPQTPRLNIQLSHRSGQLARTAPAPVSALDIVQQARDKATSSSSSAGRRKRASHG